MITPTRGLTFLMPETAYVVTRTFTSDSGGGATATRGTAGTAFCRLDAMSGSEQEVAERISDRSTHVVSLPPETAVATENILEIVGHGSFEVTAVRTHSDELTRVVEVVAQ